ncbi:MAG TPA: substrate-binding domain-containing protein [Anaerohalosphaeraceae bacterium]|nr:substrate-binding domain-containing protein [Anaerohalosphaeraceae bacterium]
MALSSTHHGFFQGISRYAGEHGWHLHTFMAYSGVIPQGWRGDGIISFAGYREDLADFIRQSPFPVVEISQVRDDLDVPRVDGDNFNIGKQAAEYFLERHFKFFAWAPFAKDTPNIERLHGYQQTLAERGFEVHILPTNQLEKGHAAFMDWAASRKQLIAALKSIPRPFAVFTYNDSVGAEIVNACLDGNLLVPEQVSVLGVDNDQTVCQTVPVPLSSIRFDLDELAYAAAALLDRMMDGQSPPNILQRIQPRGVVTRKSTDIWAMNNVEVAKALSYIWSHFDDPGLSVEEVASQTSLTSRGLLKAFQAELNRSIHDEIIRIRMERAMNLLTNTSESITDIAFRTGFNSSNNFFRVFYRINKIGPRRYRNQLGPANK